MSATDVLYCIEHVARELNVACAVSSIAERGFGINVDIHVLNQTLSPRLDHASPKLIALPFCVSRKFVARSILEQFPGVPIVNLACEQLYSRANRRHRLPKDDLARHQVTHAAAGPFFRDWLIDAGVTPDRVEVVGSLPFQLYRDPYRKYFGRRRLEFAETFGLNPALPWVVLPENFGAAFFTRSQRRKRTRGGYRRRHLREYIRYAQESLREISDWCGAAASVANAEIIVRPRPAMAQQVLVDTMINAATTGAQKHWHFIKEGTIQDWIFASDLVVSSYSTTLLEAAVAGVPAFMLEPIEVPYSAGSEWHAVAPSVRKRDDFLALIDSVQDQTAESALSDWAQQNLLSSGDAIENTARLFADICHGKRQVPTPAGPPRIDAAISCIQDLGRMPERLVRRAIKRPTERIFGHECDRVDKSLVDACQDRWDRLLDENTVLEAA